METDLEKLQAEAEAVEAERAAAAAELAEAEAIAFEAERAETDALAASVAGEISASDVVQAKTRAQAARDTLKGWGSRLGHLAHLAGSAAAELADAKAREERRIAREFEAWALDEVDRLSQDIPAAFAKLRVYLAYWGSLNAALTNTGHNDRLDAARATFDAALRPQGESVAVGPFLHPVLTPMTGNQCDCTISSDEFVARIKAEWQEARRN